MSEKKPRYWGFHNRTDQNKFIKGVNHIIKAATRSGVEELHWSGSTDDYEIDISLKRVNKEENKDAGEESNRVE